MPPPYKLEWEEGQLIGEIEASRGLAPDMPQVIALRREIIALHVRIPLAEIEFKAADTPAWDLTFDFADGRQEIQHIDGSGMAAIDSHGHHFLHEDYLAMGHVRIAIMALVGARAAYKVEITGAA